MSAELTIDRSGRGNVGGRLRTAFIVHLSQPLLGRMVGCAVALSTLGGCVVHTLPPPPVPARDMPVVSLPPTPPYAGYTRVLIATDVPARVALWGQEGRPTGPTDGRRPIMDSISCDNTPCVLTLPQGEHQLHFEGTGKNSNRTSTAKVVVRDEIVVVNHALGKDEKSAERVYGIGLLSAGLISIGLSLIPFPSYSSSEWRTTSFAIDCVAIVSGVVLLGFSTETLQEGATIQWTLPAATERGPGISFRRTF
jgi:hypothetical protein